MVSNSISIHIFIKMRNKFDNSFFLQWDFFFGTEEAHPEKALTNINKILPFNHYHHVNLEGLRNSESQFTKSGE